MGIISTVGVVRLRGDVSSPCLVFAAAAACLSSHRAQVRGRGREWLQLATDALAPARAEAEGEHRREEAQERACV